MNNDLKLASIVVTYNRKQLLVKNLDALLSQTIKHDIIVVDNASSDNTYEYLKENGYIDNKNVVYYKLKENIGGAGGFAEGIKKAVGDGYNLFWLMDDDGYPLNEYTLENLIKLYRKVGNSPNGIMINSLVLCDESNLSFGLSDEIKDLAAVHKIAKDNIIFDMISPFNGTLIDIKTVKNIGVPNKDFFIRGDEREYTARAVKNKVTLATETDSLYHHPGEKNNFTYFLGKKIDVSDESAWKEYYITRNYIYICKHYKTKSEMIKFIISKAISTFYFTGNKNQKRKMIAKGIMDGLLNKSGKRVNP